MNKYENKYEKMLKNAGTIQHYSNIIYGDDYINDPEDYPFFWRDEEGSWWLAYHEENGRWADIDCPFWVVKFFIKGRTLRGGLASPMARRLAWNAINDLPIMPKF